MSEPGVPVPDGPQAQRRAHPPRFLTAKRLSMAAATAFLTINIWTGAPLAALWVGSAFSDQKQLSMGAVLVVLIVLALLVFAMAVALTWLSNTYDELIGREPGERRATWLRSMRAEEKRHVSSRVGTTALEQIVMASVYLAVVTLLVWLVFFAGSMVSSQLQG